MIRALSNASVGAAIVIFAPSAAAQEIAPSHAPSPTAPTPMQSPGAIVAYLPTPIRPLGVDVVTSIASLPLGSELLTGEVEGRVALVRALGRFSLSLAGTVGRGLDVREDVDGEASALAAFRVGAGWLGFETHARGELVDGIATIEDLGRPIEVSATGAAGATLGAWALRGNAGWLWPRGPLPSGPAALGTVTLSF